MAIPANYRIDPIIDHCIRRSQTLSNEIQALHTDLNSGLIQTTSDLRDRYTPLYEKLVYIVQGLKPAAYAKCNKMRYDEAAPLKANVDAAIGTLKTKHKNLIFLINEHLHENKLPFPNSLSDFKCYCNWPRKFVRQNAGWIVAGSAAFISLMTLTSFGSYAGPYLAKTPKFFGDAGRDFGEFLTDLLSSDAIKKAATSDWASTAGKIALVPALGYPAYCYLKEPVMKLAKKCDKMIAAASEAPMATFITAWALYYTVSRQMGFEGTFAKSYVSPFHARLMVTFGAAFLTPGAVNASKSLIDDYKNRSIELLEEDLPPPVVINRRNPNPADLEGDLERLELNEERPLPPVRNRGNPAQNRNPAALRQAEENQQLPPDENVQQNQAAQNQAQQVLPARPNRQELAALRAQRFGQENAAQQGGAPENPNPDAVPINPAPLDPNPNEQAQPQENPQQPRRNWFRNLLPFFKLFPTL